MMARIEQSIEVNVPPRAAYEQLMRFEQYPRFMQDVQEVRKLDERHLHWHTKTGDLDLEWDAEITQQVPERCIAWRRTDGHPYEGKIELQPLAGERTRVRLTVDCDPQQQGPAADADPQAWITLRSEHDLLRFKQFVEKLGRDSGQWRGREQEGAPSHSAPAELAAGAIDCVAAPPTNGVRPPTESEAVQADAPQQPFGADQADNAQAVGRQTGPDWSVLLPSFMQAWGGPLDMMRRMSDDMEQIFGRLARHSIGVLRGQESRDADWTPALEVVRSGERVLVYVELAGVPREDVSVDIRSGQLVIEGSRKPKVIPDQQRNSERAYGRFRRQLPLPDGADADAISAVLREGVLEVTVPLRPGSAHGRRVEIGDA
jgi:HSP20 family molecular chaperone IbpA